jgi:hypothetical protein
MLRLAPMCVFACMLLTVSLSAATAAPTSASAASPQRSAATWCALVIKINTQAGYMHNKRYLPPSRVTPKLFKAVVETALPYANQLTSAAPNSIKKAQRDEITYLRHIRANHYSQTPLAPYTPAEAGQLLDFQHKQCGITGP